MEFDSLQQRVWLATRRQVDAVIRRLRAERQRQDSKSLPLFVRWRPDALPGPRTPRRMGTLANSACGRVRVGDLRFANAGVYCRASTCDHSWLVVL